MTDWNSVGSDVDAEAICCGEERAQTEGKAFNLEVNLRPNSHLWSCLMTKGIRLQIQAAKTSFLCRTAGLSMRDRVRSSDIQGEAQSRAAASPR